MLLIFKSQILEVTLGLEPRNEAFAEPSLTNLGTSPRAIILNFFVFSKAFMKNLLSKERFFSFFIALWLKTLRIRVKLPPNYAPGVLTLWHEDLPAATAGLRNRHIHTLISASRDGGLLAAVASRLGYSVVRGSSSRAALSVRKLLTPLSRGEPVAMALDGPKGPALQEKPGAAWLAQKSNTPLWHILPTYTSYFRLHSWDKMKIPLPFSKIVIQIVYFSSRK